MLQLKESCAIIESKKMKGCRLRLLEIMKISVSSYSFERLVQKGQMTQLDTIKKAKELGFDCIEFTEIKPHDGSTQLEYATKIATAAKEAGICVNCYTIAAHFAVDTDEELQAEVERMKGQVDIAEALGVHLMRQDSMRKMGNYRSFDQALPMLAKGVRAVCEYAETKGIKTMIENHGYFCQDSVRVEKLVNAVAHPNFGLLVDMGNFMCADGDPVASVRSNIDIASFIHFKDFFRRTAGNPPLGEGWMRTRAGHYLRATVIGHGSVELVPIVKIIKESGYDGYISVEFEGKED